MDTVLKDPPLEPGREVKDDVALDDGGTINDILAGMRYNMMAGFRSLQADMATQQAEMAKHSKILATDSQGIQSLQAEMANNSAILATHSQDTSASFVTVGEDIDSKLTTLELTLKGSMEEQLAKRDNAIDEKLANLR